MSKGKEIKICFAASTGGHFEQLLMLKPLMERFNFLRQLVSQYLSPYYSAVNTHEIRPISIQILVLP